MLLFSNLSSRADELWVEEALSEASAAFQQVSLLVRIAIQDAALKREPQSLEVSKRPIMPARARARARARHYFRSHFPFGVDLREVFVVEEDQREASNRFRPMGPFVHC